MSIKAGVIGVGLLGERHCYELKKNKMVQLRAIAETSRERREKLAKKLKVNSYESYEDMLSKEELDLLVVATPDFLHKDPVIKAAEANVPHIICQKPLSTRLDDALEMVRTAQEKGSDLYVLFENRFNPMDMTLKHFLKCGLIGRVLYGEARLDDSITVPMGLWGKRSREWACHSSPAHFLLSHVVDLLNWFFAPAKVQEVYAFCGNEILSYSVDIYDAFLFFDSGLKVRVKSEWVKHIDELVEFYLCFTGMRGNIIYNKRPGFGVRAGLRLNVDKDVGLKDLLDVQEELSQKGINIRVFSQKNARIPLGAEVFSFKDTLEEKTQMDYFIEAIVEGTKEPSSWKGFGPLPSGDDGLEAVRIVSAIERSAREGKKVRIER